MTQKAKHPTLYDYNTNEIIRKATRKEEKESIASEEEDWSKGGLIMVDGRECFVWEKELE